MIDATIVVIVVTGKQVSHAAAEVLKAGVFAYMPKPCDFSGLELAAVRFQGGDVD